MSVEKTIKRRLAQDEKWRECRFSGRANTGKDKGKPKPLAPSLKSNRPERYTVTEKDGCPAVEVRWPDGRREIAAIMVNTEFGHELAEMVCEHRNYASIVL